MKKLLLILLLSSLTFAQTGKSVLTQAQKDSVAGMISDSLDNFTSGLDTNTVEGIINTNALSKTKDDTSNYHLELSDVRFGGETVINPRENSQGWRRPIISFVFDDADTNVYRLFDTLFTNRGVNFSFSVYLAPQVSRNGIIMSISEALELQSNGHEIESHVSASTGWGAGYYTEVEADNYIDSLKSYHQSLGFNVKNCNYGGGDATELMKKVVKKYYRSGRSASGTNNINIPPIDQYYLSAYSMDGGQYNTWTSYVDSAINNKAWMIFYGHASTTSWYDSTRGDDGGYYDAGGDYIWQKIGRLIDYIQGKTDYGDSAGVTILVKNDALDEFYNIVDIGVMETQNANKINEYNQFYDYDKEYFRVSSLGQIDFYGYKNIPIVLPRGGVYTDADTIEYYPEGRISYKSWQTGGHLLVTDRMEDYLPSNQYQFLHSYNSNKLYYRQVNSSGGWQSWKQLTNEFTDTYQSAGTNATLVTGFVEDQLNLGFATTGAGYPAAGTLFTDRRLMDYDARLQYQMITGNTLNNDMYIRTWNTSTGDWRSWRKINPVSAQGNIVVDFDSVATSTVTSKNIDVSTIADFGAVGTTDMVIITPPSTIEAGLVWSAYISAANLVTIRLFNGSGTGINPASGTWKVRIIR